MCVTMLGRSASQTLCVVSVVFSITCLHAERRLVMAGSSVSEDSTCVVTRGAMESFTEEEARNMSLTCEFDKVFNNQTFSTGKRFGDVYGLIVRPDSWQSGDPQWIALPTGFLELTKT